MKISIHASSCMVAVLCWTLTSALTLFIIWGMRDRARLIRDMDNERVLNIIFTELRKYDDFGSAIESNPILSERIEGFAIYGDDLALNYRWGTAPQVFDEKMLKNQIKSKFSRYTIPDQKGDRVKFILQTERIVQPMSPGGIMPPGMPLHRFAGTEQQRRRQDFFLNNFNIFSAGKYIYINITHPGYWRTQAFTAILFPLCELALLFAVFYIRHLYLRNREYRERIEAQKNLVVLGTAASTLAHEIKNPLLSIRLQTGILRKLFPDQGQEEVAIIDEEVERLSGLIYRVSDYLRKEEGNRVPINAYDMVTGTAQRLCGRDIIPQDAPKDVMVYMDPFRARSVFENILRNALESGGDAEAVGAFITRNAGSVVIGVFDRGKGISETDMKRIFDPFFTRKSTGMGIGLSISRRFVEAVKGSIKLERREGGGTLVRIILPEWVPGSVPRHLERGAG
ncbi:MAG: HAMP domain-containing histidine kinase [Treponema sp.]|nr:HAMP domain-containing histidine kinase [Treponema sp.]